MDKKIILSFFLFSLIAIGFLGITSATTTLNVGSYTNPPLQTGTWNENFGTINSPGSSGGFLNAAAGNQWNLTGLISQGANPTQSSGVYKTDYTSGVFTIAPGSWGDGFTLNRLTATVIADTNNNNLNSIFYFSAPYNGMTIVGIGEINSQILDSDLFGNVTGHHGTVDLTRLYILDNTTKFVDNYFSDSKFNLGGFSTSNPEFSSTIQSAITVANSGDIINVASGTYALTSILDINQPMSIIGNGVVILKASNPSWVNSPSTKHLIDIFAGTQSSPVTISNVILDSNNQAWGIQAYGANAYSVLKDVLIENSKGAGLTVNGASIIASNLNTQGNAWGSVNVDPGVGVIFPSVFIFNSGSLGENTQIWSDGNHVTGSATINVIASGYNKVVMDKKIIWTNRALNLNSFSVIINSTGTLPAMILSSNDSNNIQVSIPAETTITGNSPWNGTLNLPQLSSFSPAAHPLTDLSDYQLSGFSKLIEIGFSGVSLNLSNPVNITISGETGKHVAYSTDGKTFFSIPLCSQTYNETNLVGGSCYYDDGINLIISTMHFTQFMTYTPVPRVPNGAGYTNAGSGSGGGGGGGYIVPATTPSATNNANSNSASTTTNPSNTKTTNTVTGAPITGGVINSLTSTGGIVGIAAFLLVLILVIIFVRARKKKISN